MKKLLIIGASVLQLPAIIRAKEMGLCVAVADFNPEAIGIPYADRYYNVSTIDEVGVYNAAKDFGADGIMTLATDMPMRALAYATKKLGIPGISYDTAIKSTDKGEMIKAFKEHNVSHPWYYIVSDIMELEKVAYNITYPCISKPTDNSGSRGVMLINSEDELKKAVEYSSSQGRKGGVIIEEYMKGFEVSVEIIVLDGVCHILQVTDKLTTGAPHFVEMGHSQPSGLPEDKIEEIHTLAKKAVFAVGITNGPAHVEIMLTENGPKMIELGARMGGDCITTHLVPLSTGIDMVKATIDIALGQVPDIMPKFHKGSAIRFLDAPCGEIAEITGCDNAKEIDGIREISLTKKVGDMSGSIDSSTDRLGFVIAQQDTSAKAIESCEKALEFIKINIK
ncbi:MAG: ATP-grasp domain-containing protein [Clostridia bacterium]|nr:ATP-grasp domain-containing protein [Clostridia bacterium]